MATSNVAVPKRVSVVVVAWPTSNSIVQQDTAQHTRSLFLRRNMCNYTIE